MSTIASSPTDPPLARAVTATTTRNAAIDHLRIVLTLLVILHHTAITYGGSGGWYWRQEPNASNRLLILFNAINQSYFMGFFFLLAGYYTPASYDRKGPGRFFTERLQRLGVPLLIYFLFLSTFTIALGRTHDGHPLWAGWLQMMREGHFGPGPLWFAETLLLFAAAYLAWRRFRPASPDAIRADTSPPLPSFRALALTALGLGLANFLVRFAVPVGENVLWLQLGYFPCYIYLFIAGCAASRSRLLENITFAQARPWLIVSAIALVTLPLVIVFNGAAGHFEGGLHLNALYYAFWDPFAASGIILGLLWAARTFWSRATPLTAWLARNAYGAFILHPPVVVAFSLAFVSVPLAPLGKFVLVGALASAGSFLAAAALRAIPGAGRVL